MAVVHCPKKVNNKWRKPFYTHRTLVETKEGEKMNVVGGTQCLDGLWAHIRASLKGCHGSEVALMRRLRWVQWRLWQSRSDMVKALASTL